MFTNDDTSFFYSEKSCSSFSLSCDILSSCDHMMRVMELVIMMMLEMAISILMMMVIMILIMMMMMMMTTGLIFHSRTFSLWRWRPPGRVRSLTMECLTISSRVKAIVIITISSRVDIMTTLVDDKNYIKWCISLKILAGRSL